MNIFLTGATGFIGSQMALKLAEQGHTIHALVRSIERAKKEVRHESIKFFEGNLDDLDLITKAVSGCEQAYLLAAFAQVWDKNTDTFYKINVRNNIALIKQASSLGVKKIVVTSTAGVFGPSRHGLPVTEASTKWTDLTTDYEKSKAQAEIEIKKLVHSQSLDIIIVNPTRVYGPGKLSQSNSVTRMIKEFNKGKWHVYPGNGKAMGNYVFVKDVIEGHILAMQKGKAGENYILGGENASYRGLFEKVTEVSGNKTWLTGIPIPIMMLIAKLQMALISLTGKGPILTPGFVKKYTFNWINSSKKAERELGYKPTSLIDGIKAVITWSQN
ncbi:MAG: NAD-dependent epimerase/dehydratase family protein [Flavobacteriales bacterium]